MYIYPHAPYFYIIQHIPSGKLYGGAKWEEGCNPATFMVEGGYTTSSIRVNDLIKEDGVESFRKILVITEFGYGMTSNEYETVFLQTNDIANDDNWLNGHNNDYTDTGYGTPAYNARILSKYGVYNISQLDEIKEKKKITCMENYGVEYSAQSDIVQDKIKITNRLKYGKDYYFQTTDFKNKSIETFLVNHGVSHPSKSPTVRSKNKSTNKLRRGVEHPMQDPTVKDKYKNTCNEKFGGHPLQNEDIRNKIHETTILLYGCDNVFQNEEIKENIKKNNVARFGVDHHNKTPEGRKAVGERTLGAKFWNDGIKNYLVPTTKTPEPHWIPGMKPRKSN